MYLLFNNNFVLICCHQWSQKLVTTSGSTRFNRRNDDQLWCSILFLSPASQLFATFATPSAYHVAAISRWRRLRLW